MTRSMTSFLHFEFLKSIVYHPMGFLTVFYFLSVIITNKTDYFKNLAIKNSVKVPQLFSFKFVAAIFISIWIIRLLINFTTQP
ncbi:MAG: DUF2752 domain-containing protein [Calditrichaeota bacterium]|nr:DUF2752 domain-containing protein [Calditrichota bacterium]